MISSSLSLGPIYASLRDSLSFWCVKLNLKNSRSLSRLVSLKNQHLHSPRPLRPGTWSPETGVGTVLTNGTALPALFRVSPARETARVLRRAQTRETRERDWGWWDTPLHLRACCEFADHAHGGEGATTHQFVLSTTCLSSHAASTEPRWSNRPPALVKWSAVASVTPSAAASLCNIGK